VGEELRDLLVSLRIRLLLTMVLRALKKSG